jgi:hypothetical protein
MAALGHFQWRRPHEPTGCYYPSIKPVSPRETIEVFPLALRRSLFLNLPEMMIWDDRRRGAAPSASVYGHYVKSRMVLAKYRHSRCVQI